MLAESIHFVLRVLGWAAGLAAAVLVYELLRASVLRGARIRLETSVSRYLAKHRVRLDRFKFTHKHYIREALLNDPELGSFLLEHSVARGEEPEEVRRRAESYIEEIVPYFSLVSYYKLGFGVARPALGMLYDVDFSPDNLKRAQAGLSEGDAVVFVMNHRSNADYVLFAYCMSREVALSYAVGEWARVWPLETLFKSFGSYFVRRGERDPVYHRVLQRYIRLVTQNGLTQGIFLEGGLSRDGRLRSPKVGLLDSLLQVASDPSFGGEVWFVPVGLNYDRVLEDTNLLREAEGTVAPPRAVDKAASLGRLLRLLPRAAWGRARRLVRGAWKLAWTRRVSFGAAAARAGAPVGMKAWFGERLPEVAGLDRHGRREELERFAASMMERIAEVVPVTAVPLAVAALERAGGFEPAGASRREVVEQIEEITRALREAGVPLGLGPEIAEIAGERAAVLDEADVRGGLLDFESHLLEVDEAQAVLRAAEAILRSRKVLDAGAERIGVRPAGAALLRYYRYSIDRQLERAGVPVEEPPAAARI